MLKVFIDTNILLDIYHLSGPDLEELRKLIKLIQNGKVTLLLSQQVVDEFWRNREGVIADAMKTFRDSKAQAKIPNLLRNYAETSHLKDAVDTVNGIVKALAAKVQEDIGWGKLMADHVIQEFLKFTASKISPAVMNKARRRVEIGNPPGKKGSLGDAINWEWLLEQETGSDDEFFIISQDGDYESELYKGAIKEFLQREWNEDHRCIPMLEKSLTDFMKHKFPDIQLADEVDKLAAIELLEQSGSFTATHNAIAQLSTHYDFRDSEIIRLLKAYTQNNQVMWILGDEDVKEFAKKIVQLAKSEEAKTLADFLSKSLEQIED